MSATNDSNSLANATLPADMEAALNKAFIEAPTTLSYTPTDKEQADTKRFALQNNAYYNLEAYLQIGVSLPATGERFEEIFPKEDLKALTDLDDQIYGDLKKCLVDIHQHTSDFGSKTFSRFHTVSHSIITFCDFFAKRVEGKGCLREQIAILSDESIEPGSPKIPQAVKICQYLLNILSKESKKREDECQLLVEELTAFKLVTEADKKDVDELHSKLIGPRPDGKTPYTDELLGQLAALQRSLQDKIQKMKAQSDKTESRKKIMVYTAIFGFIAAAINLVLSLMEEVEDYKTQVASEEAKQKILMNGIHCVTNICSSISEIEKAINAALEAVKSFTATFGRLHEDFKTIGERMGDIHEKIREEEPFIRALANTDLEDACSKWMDIKTLAIDFVTFKPLKAESLEEVKAIAEKEGVAA